MYNNSKSLDQKKIYLEIDSVLYPEAEIKDTISEILNTDGYLIVDNINMAYYSLKITINEGRRLQACQFKKSELELIEKTNITELIKIVNIQLIEYQNTFDEKDLRSNNLFFLENSLKKTNLFFYIKEQDDLLQMFKDILTFEFDKVSN